MMASLKVRKYDRAIIYTTRSKEMKLFSPIQSHIEIYIFALGCVNVPNNGNGLNVNSSTVLLDEAREQNIFKRKGRKR